MALEYGWPLQGDLSISCSFKCHKSRKPPSGLPGTDYPKKSGTPIYAIADGVVEVADHTDNSANGKYVKLRHGKGHRSYYLHMSKLAAKCVPGAKIKKGACIGYVGTTGASSGPHLHLSITSLNVLIDPHKFLAARVK